jgi:hypothetical protein
MSKGDDLMREMERVAKAFQAPDQLLELDIQKVINTLRSEAKLGREEVEAIDFAMHNPDKLKWEAVPKPEPPIPFQPTTYQVQWFRDMIKAMPQDEYMWRVPSTGQEYMMNRVKKTFTLVKETPDPEDWHTKNKKILSLIGWKMIDSTTTMRTFNAKHGPWTLTVLDFSIDAQVNPKTGMKYAPGTRGQEAMANNGTGTVVRLGHQIGRWFIKHVASDSGIGKSIAFTE